MNTHSQKIHNKIYSIKQKSPSTGEIIGSKFIKSQNMLMTICRPLVTRWGKISGFSTTIIENSAYAMFVRYEHFSDRNWYHKATAAITTFFFITCPISWRNVIELIQNWDNQDQQAKGFQMRYKLSKLNNQNYQTLTHVFTKDGITLYCQFSQEFNLATCDFFFVKIIASKFFVRH